MRFDIVIAIVVFSCVAFGVGMFGLTTYWMRKIHNSLLEQFTLLHSLFLINEHEKKGCECGGEKHNN